MKMCKQCASPMANEVSWWVLNGKKTTRFHCFECGYIWEVASILDETSPFEDDLLDDESEGDDG